MRGTPMSARPLARSPSALSRKQRHHAGAARRAAPRAAIQDNTPPAGVTSADADAEYCDPMTQECPQVPRQVVNGQDLPIFEDVSTAHFRIRSGVVRSRCTKSKSLSAITGMNILIKHEWEQATGSFKERGARNALLALDEAQRARGVVAASAGNHALALAYHGKDLGIPVTVLMPSIAPLTKISKCRALGANVILEGDSIADAALAAKRFVENQGMKYINGFDDFNIIAGAGSVGLEILEDIKDVDAIVVPVGGGGLIAGVALAVKTINPNVMVIGVEPDRCPSMAAAFAAGKVVKFDMPGPTLADGLAVPTVGPRSFEVCRPRVDKLVTVSERDISVGLLRLVECEKLVQEGAGAAGMAACLAGEASGARREDRRRPVVRRGTSTRTRSGTRSSAELVNDGRQCRFSVVVPDRPGGIAGLTAVIAEVGASIKQINHERAWLQEDSHSVQVDVTCELTGIAMADTLYEELSARYKVDFTRPKSALTNTAAAPMSSPISFPTSANAAAVAKPSSGPQRLPAPGVVRTTTRS